jgi:hypothetical protein
VTFSELFNDMRGLRVDDMRSESLTLLESPHYDGRVPRSGKDGGYAKGDGPALDVSRISGRIFLLTLAITNIIEQESLDVGIYGSADGATWDAKPIVAFPQKFYREEIPLAAESYGAAGDQVYPRALGRGAVGARLGNADVRVSCNVARSSAGDSRGSRGASADAIGI